MVSWPLSFSLLISLVKGIVWPSDSGSPKPRRPQASGTWLFSSGLGSAPHVHMMGPEDGGIRVLCSSGGWFPKPRVQWSNMAGVKLPTLSESQTQDGDGLFYVEASLVVTDSSLGNVTCSIQNPFSGQEKVSAIFLPGQWGINPKAELGVW